MAVGWRRVEVYTLIMKIASFLLWALVIVLLLFAPLAQGQTSEKLLIVHADDLGMAHSVNAASIAAFGTGLVNSASIMVPCPWFPEAAAWAREHPQADIGLHLTLTSEWSGFRWGPVLPKSQVPSLLDNNGYFFATEEEAVSHIDPREAEAEIRAQIARAREFGIKPTHLDSHMGTLYQNRALFEVLMRVAREEHLPARISRALVHEPFRAAVLEPDDIIIDHVISISPEDQTVRFYTEQLKKLEPGVTEVVIHLAHDDDEMRAISANHPHWGAAWRQRDLDFFTSDEFRGLLRQNNIRLTTWREVAAIAAARKRS
jgi:predicted glycoside hydrolase/deacetylase ChbG (UPF0249 family)